MAPTGTERDDLVASAGEHALGLGDATVVTPELAAEIRRWEDDLAALALAVPAQAPPHEVWDRIETAIGGVAPAPVGGAWLDRLGSWWRALAAAEAVAIIVLLVAWTQQPVVPPVAPPAVVAAAAPEVAPLPDPAPPSMPRALAARLADRDGDTLFLVTFDPAQALLVVVAAQGRMMDQGLRLWATLPGTLDPILLGAVAGDGLASLRVPTEVAAQLGPRTMLAVTGPETVLRAHGALVGLPQVGP